MKLFEFDQHIGKWRVLVQTRDISNGAVTSAKIALQAILTELIADLAVTTAKLADESVTTAKLADISVITRKLADLSVTTAKLDNLSVTPEKIAALAVITEKIADLAVTTRKIAHEAVTTEKLAPGSVVNEKIGDLTISWGKLDTDLQNVIASAGAHGVALSNEFGNSELIGISQKTLTESRDDLQNQIDEIVGGGASVSLSASPATIFVGEEKTITLNATTNKTATSIDITGGNISGTIHGSGMSKSGTDVITPASPGTITYTAAFVISNKTRTATRSVTAVYPIYYGAGMEQSDVLDVLARRASARTSPNGTYNVTISDTPKYIWFFVPANMPQITSAKWNGFDFPLEAQADVTDASGVAYKVYRTPNTNETGSYNIDINPS